MTSIFGFGAADFQIHPQATSTPLQTIGGSASETITDPIVHDPSGRIPPWAYSVPSYKPPEEILIQDFR